MQGKESLQNFCEIIVFRLRETLITLALQEGNLRANHDRIDVCFLCVFVVHNPSVLFCCCVLLSGMICNEPGTLLCSEANTLDQSTPRTVF
jgi:hypothetical protein